MPTQHERLFHGIGAGDDLRVVDTPAGRDRRADLLGEPDAAGPLRGLPWRPADLGGADRRRLRRLAGHDAPHRDRVRARSWSPCRSSSPARRSRRTSRCRSSATRVRPRRRGDRRADLGRGDRGAAVRRGGDRGRRLRPARGLHAKRWFDAVGHYGREDVLFPPAPVTRPSRAAQHARVAAAEREPLGVEALEQRLGVLARGAELVAQAAERDLALGLEQRDERARGPRRARPRGCASPGPAGRRGRRRAARRAPRARPGRRRAAARRRRRAARSSIASAAGRQRRRARAPTPAPPAGVGRRGLRLAALEPGESRQQIARGAVAPRRGVEHDAAAERVRRRQGADHEPVAGQRHERPLEPQLGVAAAELGEPRRRPRACRGARRPARRRPGALGRGPLERRVDAVRRRAAGARGPAAPAATTTSPRATSSTRHAREVERDALARPARGRRTRRGPARRARAPRRPAGSSSTASPRPALARPQRAGHDGAGAADRERAVDVQARAPRRRRRAPAARPRPARAPRRSASRPVARARRHGDGLGARQQLRRLRQRARRVGGVGLRHRDDARRRRRAPRSTAACSRVCGITPSSAATAIR